MCAIVAVGLIIVICKSRCKCIPCLHRKLAKKGINHAETPHGQTLANQKIISVNGVARGPIASALRDEFLVTIGVCDTSMSNGGNLTLDAHGNRVETDGGIAAKSRSSITAVGKGKNVPGIRNNFISNQAGGTGGKGHYFNGQDSHSSSEQNARQHHIVPPFVINGKLIPDTSPPLKVELLYKVKTKPTTSKAVFDSAKFLSNISLRTSD